MAQQAPQRKHQPAPEREGATQGPTNAPKAPKGKGAEAPGLGEPGEALQMRGLRPAAPRGRPVDPPFKPSPVLEPSDRRRLKASEEDAAACARRRYAFWAIQAGCPDDLGLLGR
jgi:hypothetical protein